MKLVLKSRFACTAERCFDEVKTSRLLLHIARPLLHFIPMEPSVLPVEWEEREYKVGIRLLGLIPMGHQMVRISGQDHSASAGKISVELRDNGSGTWMQRWDHRIFITAADEGCDYTDQVDIRAGLVTPVIWLFAWYFYRHRQHRWRQLIRRNFTYA